MRVSRIISILMVGSLFMQCSAPAFAKPYTTEDQEAARLTNALRFVRMEPTATLDQKKHVALDALSFVRKRAAKMLGVSDPSQLVNAFAKDPDLSSHWNTDKDGYVKDPGLRDLISELGLMTNELSAEKVLGGDRCKDFKRDLANDVMMGVARVDACHEGFAWKTQATFRYPAGKTTKVGFLKAKTYYKVVAPSFALAKSVEELEQISDVVAYYADQSKAGNQLAPTLDEIRDNTQFNDEHDGIVRPKRLTQEDLAQDARAIELRSKAYERTMLETMRNQLRLEYQYSDKYLRKDKNGKLVPISPDEGEKLMQKRAIEILGTQCDFCQMRPLRESVLGSLKNIITDDIRSQRVVPTSSSDVAKELCDGLKALQYPFISRPDSYNSIDLDPQGTADEARRPQIEDRDRRSILAKLVFTLPDGKLILTGALTNIDKTDPDPASTKLSCKPGSEAQDAALVRDAQKEAIGYGKDFAQRIDDSVNLFNYSPEKVNADNISMLEIARKPFGEAVTLSSSGGAPNYTCALIKAIDRGDRLQAKIDNAATWGVIGLSFLTGGTFTGFAALLGSAIMEFGPATYSVIRANQTLDQSKIYREAAIAQGFDDALLHMSEKSKAEYQSFLSSAYVGYGLGMVDAMKLIKFVVLSSKAKTVAQELAITNPDYEAEAEEEMEELTGAEVFAVVEKFESGGKDLLGREIQRFSSENSLARAQAAQNPYALPVHLTTAQIDAVVAASEVDLYAAKNILLNSGKFTLQQTTTLLADRAKSEQISLNEIMNSQELDAVVVKAHLRKKNSLKAAVK